MKLLRLVVLLQEADPIRLFRTLDAPERLDWVGINLVDQRMI